MTRGLGALYWAGLGYKCGLGFLIKGHNLHSKVLSDREIEWGYVFAAAGYALSLGILSWLLLFCPSFSSANSDINTDRSSLIAFKSRISFDPHNILTKNWSGEGCICRWMGVTCDSRYQMVTQLNISSMGLAGTIPPEIGNLSFLVSLDISNNSFHGPIPHSIFNMSFLQVLNLRINSLSSSLPDDICKHNLHRLKYLRISYNELYGEIPSSLGQCSKLEYLSLYNNSFSGHVPTQIGNLTLLQLLNLGANYLSGIIPKEISALANLQKLGMSINNFSGPVPSEIGNLTMLQILYLDSNTLNGNIPEEIGGLTNLQSLGLSYNRLKGPLPSTIFSMPSLQYADFAFNELSGSLSRAIGNMTSLLRIGLEFNNFTGNIPKEIGHLSNFERLSMSGNMFSGSLPREIGNLTNMCGLFLHSNALSGVLCSHAVRAQHSDVEEGQQGIHAHFHVSPFILYRVLPRNNMTGWIPDNISPNCSLKTLDVSHNNLVGGVPLSLENCTSLEVMNVRNNHIVGNFPCMLPSSLRLLVLRSNRFHGEITCQKSWPSLQIIDIASNNFSGKINPFNFTYWRGMVLDRDAELERINLGVMATIGYYYGNEVTLTIKGQELELVKIWPEFISIDFSCNNFHGEIPVEIGKLNSLYLLNLSHNALTGRIPKSFGKLRQLGSLDLSMNQLTGEIPKEIASLTFLVVMNVSHNKLVGEIPIGNQLQTFSADSFEGNTGLCGLPLNISCTNPSPRFVEVESDREIEWDYVFATAGYVVGLGGFSWVLLLCPSFRYKYFEKVEDVFEEIFECCQSRKEEIDGVVRNQVRRDNSGDEA
ncbi:hypothetical protein SASPL_136777 [Salvia splendens]|uniref:Leucine-rich repeat-containing N-terminal plant-type domain-containing protein n=1 Tax=Salvia splendens TaxID=180675 RepID=A0A8X8X0G3_SALSN|nr:hypothetical protein SASPL_136777 [Salvia splendens]